MSRWKQFAANWSHALFWACCLVLFVTGLLAAGAWIGEQIASFWHWLN